MFTVVLRISALWLMALQSYVHFEFPSFPKISVSNLKLWLFRSKFLKKKYFFKIKSIVFISATNASFILAMQVHDTCSAFITSIDKWKKTVLQVMDIFEMASVWNLSWHNSWYACIFVINCSMYMSISTLNHISQGTNNKL